MDWLSIVPWVLVSVALLYLPGLLVLAPMRIPVLPYLATAPAVSLTLMTGTAFIAYAIDQRWSVIWVAAAAVLLTALVGICCLLRKKHRPAAPPHQPSIRIALQYVGGVVLGTAVFGHNLLNGLVSPAAFAQRFDNAFHLNLIRLIAETGIASPLGFGAINASTSYPPAWHQWSGLVVQLTGIEIPTAVQACTLVLLLVAWPLAMSWLVESWFPIGAVGRWAVGGLSLACVSFPLGLLDWGTLYPNLLSTAIAPALVAAGWTILGYASSIRISLDFSIVLFLFTLTATLAANPISAFAGCLMLAPGVLVKLVVAFRRWRESNIEIESETSRIPQINGSRALTLLLAAALLIFPLAWAAAGAGLWDEHWQPFETKAQALGEILLGTSMGKRGAWTLSLGVVIGLIALLRRYKTNIGIILSFTLVGITYLSTATMHHVLARRFIGGPFYNDSHRTAAALVIVTLPIAIYGWDRLLNGLIRAIRHRWPQTPTAGAIAQQFIAAMVCIALAAATIASPGWLYAIGLVRSAFLMDENSDILTPQEYELIRRIPDHVPEDETVVVNPWQGGGLVFAFAERRPTQFYLFNDSDPELDIINRELDQVGTDESVCPAVSEEDVSFVLVLEPHYISQGQYQDEYVGLLGLADQPGFTVVDQEGESMLLRIDACS